MIEGSREPALRWLVVTSAFIVNFLGDGILCSFGVLLVALVEDLKDSTAAVSAIGAIVLGSFAFTSPFAGSLSGTYGKRKVALVGATLFSTGFFVSAFAANTWTLYFSFGVLGGVGFALMYNPSISSVMEHFTTRRSLASGIALCGSGVGTFVLNHLTNTLISMYGWRGTMFVLSGLLLHGVPCALVLRPPIIHNKSREMQDLDPKCESTDTYDGIKDGDIIHDSHRETVKIYDTNGDTEEFFQLNGKSVNTCDTNFEKKPDGLKFKSKSKNRKRIYSSLWTENAVLLRDIRFISLIVSAFFYGSAFFIPFSLIPKEVVVHGISRDKASWLASSMGISNTIGRIGFGWLGDRKCVSAIFSTTVVLLLLAVSMSTSILLTTFETKLIFTCIYGALYGGYISLFASIMVETFSQENFGRAFGIFWLVFDAASLIGTPIAGLTFDRTGSFTVCYIVAGIQCILSALALLIPKSAECCSSRDEKSRNTLQRETEIEQFIEKPS